MSVTAVSSASLKLKKNVGTTGTILAGPLAGSASYFASVVMCSAARNAVACAIMFTPVEEYLSVRMIQSVTG